MATDYGNDLSCIDDLDINLGEVSGRTMLLQRALRRLSTGRGMVIDAPDDGIDLRDFLSADMTPLAMASFRAQVSTELVKDEEIFSATVTRADFTAATKTLRMSIRLIDADGPFTLTLAISDVTITLLEVT